MLHSKLGRIPRRGNARLWLSRWGRTSRLSIRGEYEVREREAGFSCDHPVFDRQVYAQEEPAEAEGSRCAGERYQYC